MKFKIGQCEIVIGIQSSREQTWVTWYVTLPAGSSKLKIEGSYNPSVPQPLEITIKGGEDGEG